MTSLRQPRAQLLTILAAATLSAELANATAKAFDEAKVKKVCQLAKELTTIGGVALYKQQEVLKEAEAALKVQAMANLAAVAAPTHQGTMLFAAAAAAAGRCAIEALRTKRGLDDTAALAITNAAKASGHVAELFELLRKASQSHDTGTCIAKTGGSGTTAATIEELNCPPEVIMKVEPKQTVDIKTIAPTGFAALTQDDTAHATGAAQKCHLLAASADSASHLWQTNNPGEQELILGLMKVTPNSVHGSTAIKIPDNSKIGTEYKATTDTTRVEKLFNSIGSLLTYQTKGCGTTVDSVLETVLSTATLTPLLQEILTNKEADDDNSNRATQAAAIIAAVAGTADVNAAALKIKLQDTVAEATATHGKTQKQIKKLTWPAEIETSIITALADLKHHVKAKTICQNETTSKDKANDKATQKTCASKNRTDCQGDCEWNKDKEICVSKKKWDEENKEATGTTANTTGNNSFLINKAPLLLAFFLF